MAAAGSDNFNFGFPTPGPQLPTAQKVLDHIFFLSEEEWKNAREKAKFDYIVVGSGFCSYAFVEHIISNFKAKVGRTPRILVLEKGTFFLPIHFQNLSPVYTKTLGGLSETFPWTLSKRTVHTYPPGNPHHHVKFSHGLVPFFGGRSIMWSAWCPTPLISEMNGWPDEIIKRLEASYYKSAKNILNVKEIGEISIRTPSGAISSPYGEAHRVSKTLLEEAIKRKEIAGAHRVIDAPLAVGNPSDPSLEFVKFSVPAPFLFGRNLIQKDAEENDQAGNNNVPYLSVACNCTVEIIEQQFGIATALRTSRGIVPIGDVKLILAVGTVPTSTLIVNSFPLEKPISNVGTKFSAHFITAIVARIPRKVLFEDPSILQDLELGAIYLGGEDHSSKLSYHIQISVLSVNDADKTAARALRYMPDVVATANKQQLQSSPNHVVFVFAALGELDHGNKENKLEKNNDSDPTTNVTLHAHTSPRDLGLWDVMDKACFDSLNALLNGKEGAEVEYWHEGIAGDSLHAATGGWNKIKPTENERRVPGLVHESSTVWLGSELDAEAPVDLNYKLKTTENVYVTGGSLWPTGASWNPTMVMCAMAQNLADILIDNEKVESKNENRKGAGSALPPTSSVSLA